MHSSEETKKIQYRKKKSNLKTRYLVFTVHSVVLAISNKTSIDNSMCGNLAQTSRPPLFTTEEEKRKNLISKFHSGRQNIISYMPIQPLYSLWTKSMLDCGQ